MEASQTTDAQGYRRKDIVRPILDAMQDLDRLNDVKRFDQYVRYYGVYLTSHYDAAVIGEVRQILLRNVSDSGPLRMHDGGIWLRLCDAGEPSSDT